jgi:hypothetical protein
VSFSQAFYKHIAAALVRDLTARFQILANEHTRSLEDRLPFLFNEEKDTFEALQKIRASKKPKKVIVQMVTRKRKRRHKQCPVKHCKKPFAPRYGGFCNEHRNTPEFKAWAKARKVKP